MGVALPTTSRGQAGPYTPGVRLTGWGTLKWQLLGRSGNRNIPQRLQETLRLWSAEAQDRKRIKPYNCTPPLGPCWPPCPP